MVNKSFCGCGSSCIVVPNCGIIFVRNYRTAFKVVVFSLYIFTFACACGAIYSQIYENYLSSMHLHIHENCFSNKAHTWDDIEYTNKYYQEILTKKYYASHTENHCYFYNLCNVCLFLHNKTFCKVIL